MIVDIIVYLSVLSGKEHTCHVCYLRNVVILVYIKYIHPYRKFMYGNYVYFVLFYSYQMILLKSTE